MFDYGDVANTDLWYSSFLSKPDRTAWTSTRVQLCRMCFRQAQRPDGKRVKPLHLMQSCPLALVRPVVGNNSSYGGSKYNEACCSVSVFWNVWTVSGNLRHACVNLTVLHTHTSDVTHNTCMSGPRGTWSDMNYTKVGTEQTTFIWKSFKVQLIVEKKSCWH